MELIYFFHTPYEGVASPLLYMHPLSACAVFRGRGRFEIEKGQLQLHRIIEDVETDRAVSMRFEEPVDFFSCRTNSFNKFEPVVAMENLKSYSYSRNCSYLLIIFSMY